MKKKKKFYAVIKGNKPGIYTQWFGPTGAEVQIREFPRAKYKSFPTETEALQWFESGGKESTTTTKTNPKKKTSPKINHNTLVEEALADGKVVIYTDGGCLNNPGPGGYGVVMLFGDKKKELSEGFKRTTNNRMELLACIEGLKSLKAPKHPVLLFSDSQYVVNGITKGWAKRWRAKNWMRTPTDPAINPDLWAQLLEQCEKHDVTFHWVKGHAGNEGNERCDQLANQASADTQNQQVDEHFINK